MKLFIDYIKNMHFKKFLLNNIKNEFIFNEILF